MVWVQFFHSAAHPVGQVIQQKLNPPNEIRCLRSYPPFCGAVQTVCTVQEQEKNVVFYEPRDSRGRILCFLGVR